MFQYQLYRLPNLTHLNHSNSCFHGQIPMEISYLTRLVSLDLSNQDSCYQRYHQILNPYYYYYNFLPFKLQPLKLENPNFKTLIKNLRPLIKLYLDSVNISTCRHCILSESWTLFQVRGSSRQFRLNPNFVEGVQFLFFD